MQNANLTVAVVGLGRMGAAMALRLHEAGFETVLWNRDVSKSERVASVTGAPVAASAAEAATRANIVLTSLADDAAVRSVFLDGGGIVEGIKPNTIVLESSTIDPETVFEVGAAIDQTGAGFLDSPVSGSVSTVEAGALTIMVGGDTSLVETSSPVLDALSAKVIHVGDRGAGAVAKLAVNGLVHGLNVALSEALVLAEKAGVERATAYEVFASGAGGAPFVQYKRTAYEDPDSAPVAFSLNLVAKDLELITGLGNRVGAPMRQAETGLKIVREAIDEGFGERDLSAVA
ncbi:MAG: NAD(P)-dependent oxidoreductase, partial [Acidimicrobiia bacterium]|nr:NAD(P)-dependent oxidoreductase [Acidimicrobiia bacterium]